MRVLLTLTKRTALLVAATLVLATFAAAQDDPRFDVSLNCAAVLSKTSAGPLGNTTLKPTISGDGLVTFRYHFTHMHGIDVNVGHTSNSQVFTVPPDVYRVNTGITEFSAAYVFRPFHGKRLDPFIFGGGAILRFAVGNQYIDNFQNAFGATGQKPLAALYGGGADYPLWRTLSLRLQYRGLIYKTPDFKLQQLFTGVYGHMAEPSVGIVLKF